MFAATAMTTAPAQADWHQTILPSSDHDIGLPRWQGFYIRPDVGYDTYDFNGGGADGFDDLTGWSIGGQIGYDQTFDWLLLGVMTDGAITFMDDTGRGAAAGLSVDLDTVGSVKGRIGATFGRWLLYATGGAAFAKLKVTGPASRETELLTGYTVGGGLEYMWNANASMRIGYNYVDFGDADFNAIPTGRLGLDGSQIDVGFIRRF